MAAHPRRAFASHSGTLVSSQRRPKRDGRSMRSHVFIVHTGNPDPGPVVCVLASELESPFVLPGPAPVPVAPGTAPRRGSPRRAPGTGRQRLTRSSLRLPLSEPTVAPTVFGDHAAGTTPGTPRPSVLGQVRSGQVRSGQVRSGQVYLIRSRSPRLLLSILKPNLKFEGGVSPASAARGQAWP
jgi:hypothetical protein